MIDSFVPPAGFIRVNIALSREVLQHVFINGSPAAAELPIETRRRARGEIQMKQIAKQHLYLSIRHFQLVMQETGQTLGHGTYVTAGQFTFTHAIDRFTTFRTPVEMMPKASNLDLRQNNILLVMIFVSVARTDVLAAAFRTLCQLHVYVFVKMIRHGACLARMSLGRTAFLRRTRGFIVVLLLMLLFVLFEELLLQFLDPELQKPVLLPQPVILFPQPVQIMPESSDLAHGFLFNLGW